MFFSMIGLPRKFIFLFLAALTLGICWYLETLHDWALNILLF